ncbi:DUF58 domain-containing protein [Pilimelia columellifera]|uniref:DUF58 domain-containing protein n=1 Tax=Pilimelia columellifera subsp. columellifera TaxID=706583 RepID=A0ABN3NAU7_9ACTN
MRAALRGLTTRGRSFLAAGAAAAVAALVLAEKDLLRVSVLLVALPLIAASYVARGRRRLECHRRVLPARIAADGSARVELELRNTSRLPSGTLLVDDHLPYALGAHPRVVLERLGQGQASTVAYTLRPAVRGHYPIGPLTVRVTDPFGLCESAREFPEIVEVTVLPVTTPLAAVRLVGERSGAGDSRGRSVAVHGDDDIAAREYRHGDDLRRVHWRSTARSGELMVRREEQPWESRATVLLDTRADAHLGDGADGSFEWAVSAVASVAVHLRAHGHKVRLVCDGAATETNRHTPTTVDVDAVDAVTEAALLDHLADIGVQRHSDLRTIVDQVRKRQHGGLVVAALGTVDDVQARALSRLRAHGGTALALVVDATRWSTPDPDARQAWERAHAAGTQALRAAGWRVVSVGRGDDLAQLWPQLGRRGRRISPVPAAGALS